MIAPIREAEVPQKRSRTSGEMRRLVASLFLDDAGEETRPAPSVSRWKAWLLVAWATVITIVYLAAMLDLI